MVCLIVRTYRTLPIFVQSLARGTPDEFCPVRLLNSPFRSHQLVIHAANVRLEALYVSRDRAALFHQLLQPVVEDEPAPGVCNLGSG